MNSEDYKTQYPIAFNRFNVKKGHSIRRGIEWQFEFKEWYEWFLKHGIDKNIPSAGLTANTGCLCRNNDTGPYHPSNVYFGTLAKNSSDARKFNPKIGQPYSGCAIKTPHGEFKSIKQCCEATGLKQWTVCKFLDRNEPGWERIGIKKAR